jgi:integrase
MAEIRWRADGKTHFRNTSCDGDRFESTEESRFLQRGIGASPGQTHGTLLHSQGTPLKVAQAQLGHSHMATTSEIYSHASGSAQRDAVNLLEEQLFPNVS